MELGTYYAFCRRSTPIVDQHIEIEWLASIRPSFSTMILAIRDLLLEINLRGSVEWMGTDDLQPMKTEVGELLKQLPKKKITPSDIRED